MWISADGRTNTNAHFTPDDAMTDRFSESLRAIARAEGSGAADRVDAGWFSLLESLADGQVDLADLSSGLENEWIPDGYLDGGFRDSKELVAYLDGLPVDWRLDGFEVVRDVLFELTELDQGCWSRLRSRFLRRGLG